jgi:tetratricopeptide (TPR) repeat protein
MDALADHEATGVAAAVRQVREWIEQRQFAAAVAAAESALTGSPEHRDLLYMLAVGLRHLQRIPEALATLERLEDAHPDYPRLYQERGHCHVWQRQAAPAIAAFERAVSRNASLPASWKALQSLYLIAGRTADSKRAATEVRKLAALPPEIVTAFSMYDDGERAAAEKVVRAYLLAHGDHVEGMRLLAKIGLDLDIADDADILLSRVLELQPDYHAARFEYVLTLQKQHKHVQALKEIDRLLTVEPDNPVYLGMRASLCAGLGDYERAVPLYRQLLARTPEDWFTHLLMAHVQKTMGHQPEAVEHYRRAAAIRPQYGDAYWSLANLKTYRFTDEELRTMRREEHARRIGLEDRYHLCFALGKALEDRGEYAESFAYYERGNALKQSECRYRPEAIEANARRQAQVCTSELFAARAGQGCADPAPIFIVGLPRSGSTLLEQILASHSQVEGTMELAEIPRLAAQLRGRVAQDSESRYPGILPELPPAELRRFGEGYLADTRAYRSGKPFFIDKMPNNFRHLGLIHLILPNAKIIDARREPLACCFSNFKQLFASGQQFTYSIENIARYYRSYVELMRHWDAVLPGKVLRVQHEELIEDFAASVRRILDFCGLDFEPACLDFHKTERRIHTASSEQVRRPINREGVDQWRHFEPWLGPLKAALGPLAAS